MKRLNMTAVGLLALSIQPLVSDEAGADEVREYLVTMTKPNQLHLIDPEAQEIIRSCDVDGDVFGPGTIQLSPDNLTAYVIHNRWEEVVGVDLANCEEVFRAHGSRGNIRAKSIASLAVSPNGDQVYVVWDRVKMGVDNYQVLEPQLAVYETDAGLLAEPIRTYPAPRQVTIMDAGMDGDLYLAGADIYRMDPDTGDIETVIPNRNWDRPEFSGPDSLAIWANGGVTREFLRPYTTAKLKDGNPVSYHWGISRVDLDSGETENKEIGPMEFIVFSMVSDPNDSDTIYGAYTQLSHFDAEKNEIVKVIDLDHTYYSINISHDGETIYVGGASADIVIYDTDFNRLGQIRMPGDMSTSTLKVARF